MQSHADELMLTRSRSAYVCSFARVFDNAAAIVLPIILEKIPPLQQFFRYNVCIREF